MTPRDQERLNELTSELFDSENAHLHPLRILALETILATLLSQHSSDVIDQATFPGLEVEAQAILGEPSAVAFESVFRRVRFFMSVLHDIQFPDEE